MVVGAALLVAALGACTSDPQPKPSGAPSPSETSTGASLPRSAPFNIAYRDHTGKLPRAKRARVLRSVTRPVRAWVNGGFVDGPWPRKRFQSAFGPFSGDAAKTARRQARLLTLQPEGRSLVDVAPQRRKVRVSVTAIRGRAVGATASVDMGVYGLDDQGQRSLVNVRGDLYLTPAGSKGWQIFGYDIDRWVGSPGGASGGRASDQGPRHAAKGSGKHQAQRQAKRQDRHDRRTGHSRDAKSKGGGA